MVNGQRYGANDLNVIGSMRLIVMANDITALYLHRNKCHASSNKCLTSSNKKLLGTSATLVVTFCRGHGRDLIIHLSPDLLTALAGPPIYAEMLLVASCY